MTRKNAATAQGKAAPIVVPLVDKPILNVADIAALANVPISTVHLLRGRGEGPAMFKVGRRLACTRQAFDEWIQSRQQASHRDAA